MSKTTNQRPQKTKSLRGDTLVEIMFAVGIFGLVAIGSIGIMNKGLYDAQKALEITMARQEIDTQAESLRFIHEAYLSEKNNKDNTQKIYTKIWSAVKNLSYSPTDPKLTHFFDSYNGEDCSTIYSDKKAIPSRSATNSATPFIVNTRRLDESTAASFLNISNDGTTYTDPAQTDGTGILIYGAATASLLESTPVYPRLLYSSTYSRYNTVTDIEGNLSDRDFNDSTATEVKTYFNTLTKAQGIWTVGIASSSTNPEFYDFYIRTCWASPGENSSNTISSTIRLFNPDHI